MGTLDSREYDRLKGRNFKPYTQGHRNMYELPLARMKGGRWSPSPPQNRHRVPLRNAGP